MKRKTNRPRHRCVTFLPPIVCIYIYIYTHIANCFHPDSKPIFLPSFFFSVSFRLACVCALSGYRVESANRRGDRGKNALNQGPEAGKIKHV